MIHVTVRLPLDSFELELSLDMKEPMTALFGPSGGGKTSLLETIAGIRQLVSLSSRGSRRDKPRCAH